MTFAFFKVDLGSFSLSFLLLEDLMHSVIGIRKEWPGLFSFSVIWQYFISSFLLGRERILIHLYAFDIIVIL